MASVLVIFALVFTVGCVKPKGTFNLDNYVEYSMNASWLGYDLYVPALGFESYSVKAGTGTVSVYANGYGYWGSMTFTVPDGSSNTLYMYWEKSTDGSNKANCLTNTKPLDVKK